MHPVKRLAALVLFVAFAFAFLTPLYVAFAAPAEAVYHRSRFVMWMQTIPYAVCAVLWIPPWNPTPPKVFLWLTVAILAVDCLLYLPWWLHPGPAGDMVGLGYILVCIVMTTAIVAISLIAFVVSWWNRRRARGKA